ncbi:ankyrin repeat [Plakobranchus ocellatus]|uniref:Ankyrin repeat n=1 Tax=Plakobranchus ocellatus TaxID=259542 RepID=A0AAV4B0W3_9GAST|nr:ankyrin repeat [Plakobranchus ocellatus]
MIVLGRITQDGEFDVQTNSMSPKSFIVCETDAEINPNGQNIGLGVMNTAVIDYKDPPPCPGQKLLDAIKSGNMKAVDDLLNDHQKDEHKQISQDHLNAALLEACRAGWKFFVHKLVRSGATVCNEQNKNCTTALHIAAQHGFLDIVNFLLHKGADVNAVDENVNTALILAVNPAGYTEMLVILLAHDAEVDAQNSEEMTALMKAVEARDIDAIIILLFARADENRKGQTSIVKVLLANVIHNRHN